MDDEGFEPVQETKIIPLWARIISWIFGAITSLIAVTIFIIGSWTLGVGMVKEIREFGLLMSLYTFGIGSLICIFSAFGAVIFVYVVKRVFNNISK